MRSVGDDERELALESYQTFAATDLLADGIVARMLAGLSTRRYEIGLEPVPCWRAQRRAHRHARPQTPGQYAGAL